MTEQEVVADSFRMIVGSITDFANRKSPVELTAPGEQVPLFRLCVWCRCRSYMPELPHECAQCGTTLRRLVRVPQFHRGPMWFRKMRLRMWLLRLSIEHEILEIPLFRVLAFWLEQERTHYLGQKINLEWSAKDHSKRLERPITFEVGS